jgi:DNA-binding transcriptional LysR family regulator
MRAQAPISAVIMWEGHALDTELIRAFIAVARNQSFTRAAEQLGTTQPLLSRAMHRLEDTVGEVLFDRSKRQIALTPSGAVFLDEAQGILDKIGVALRRTHIAGHGSPETLRIGYMATMWTQTFHRGVRKFRTLFPDVALDFRLMPDEDQANALRAGELDLGLLHFRMCDRRELTWRTIGRAKLILAVPSDWPIPHGEPIDLSSLRDRPFVLADPVVAPDIHAAHIACCDNAGFRPREVRYSRDAVELRFLVAAGLGAAFVFDTTLLTNLDGIYVAPMANPPKNLFVDFNVVWLPRHAHSNTRAFIECMTSETYGASIIQDQNSFRIKWRKASFA